MDRGQKEVTDKIRSSIKKKLTQMNAFVDDELPEYIMILIANKKNKAQIEEDLSLFLGKETTEFSKWLDELLNSLKTAPTLSNVSSVKVIKDIVEKDQSTTDKNFVNDDDGDVLALDPQECEGDFLSQDIVGEEMYVPSSVKNVKECIPKSSKLTSIVKPGNSVETRPSSRNNSTNMLIPKQAKVYPMQQQSVIKIPICSSVVPVKRSSLNIKSDDEYDPSNPSVSISSVVRVTEKKYSVPASIQANKLLLRAMDDATKSVLAGKDLNEFYKPTPIKVLTTDKPQSVLHRVRNNTRPDNIDSESLLDVTIEDSSFLSEIDLLSSPEYEEYEGIKTENESTITTKYSIPSTVSSDTDTDYKLKNENLKVKPSDAVESINQETKRPISPHFIVTLEGFDIKSLKRKRTISINSLDNDEEMGDNGLEMIDDDNLSKNMEEDIILKKQKIAEKCRYWPACKSGDLCSYHHPISPCKLFPKCKFGVSCLYIHPNCKFDALCSKKECPFTHASKRMLPFAPLNPASSLLKKKVCSKTVCKYFPNCTSRKCLFNHPALCWFGRECQSSSCTYCHLNVPSRNQMKWHA